MMVRWSVAVLALVSVLLAGCGDDDGGSGQGSSDAPGLESSYSESGGDDRSNSGFDLEPASEPCRGDAPKEVDPPPAYDGFVRLCEPEFAQNLLVIWNISNVVLRVDGDEQDPAFEVWPPDDRSLATSIVNQMEWPHCGRTWCRIRPGGRLRAWGLAEVGSHVYLSTEKDLTAAVALATSLAGAVGSKLKKAGWRGVEAAAACAENIGAAVNPLNWDESFRDALIAAPNCQSLRDLVFQSDLPPRQPTVIRILTRARSLSGGLWIDALAKGSTLLRGERGSWCVRTAGFWRTPSAAGTGLGQARNPRCQRVSWSSGYAEGNVGTPILRVPCPSTSTAATRVIPSR
jgi:hypothetical protein